MKKLFAILLFVTTQFFAQESEIIQFSMQDTTQTYLHSSVIELNSEELLFFFIERTELKVSNSSDGINWGVTSVLVDSLQEGDIYQDLVTYKTNSGKIIVAYRANETVTEYNIISSIDNGTTWSIPTLLIKSPFPTSTKTWNAKLSQTDDNKLWFTFNRTNNLDYCNSIDDGATWSEKALFTRTANSGSVVSTNDSLMFLYSLRGSDLLFKSSNDSGATWSDAKTILNDDNFNREPSVVKKSDGTLMLVYKVLELSNYFVIESTDNGLTWSAPTLFTKYVGDDLNLHINSNSESLYASFASSRSFNEYNFETEEQRNSLWYGVVGISDDVFTPPVIEGIIHIPEVPSSIDTVTFNATVISDANNFQVMLNYILNDTLQTHVEMFDDGLHSDKMANDSIYGVSIHGFNAADKIIYSVSSKDSDNNSSIRFGTSFSFDIPMAYVTGYMDVNRLKLPLDNKGVLADVTVDGEYLYGGFDDGVVVYSAGFGLSGIENSEIWSNAVLSASRIEDYQPGVVGGDKNDIVNKVYTVTSNDVPFGSSWRSWVHAVSLGAKFYDGDGDGIYNPIDLDSNGVWDENEDKPDLIGDATYWSVFNDGVPSALRRFSVDPKDIEIRQTVFAYSPDTYEKLDGVIFIRYEIENKSSVKYEDVYFSSMSDPDVGVPQNDLVGCDTILSSGYAYDNGVDAQFGNSPTFMPTIIQGAPVYIAGETFTDNNSNGIYDDGIDTPLDTANYFNGEYFKEQNYVGAKNQKMTSFTQYMSSHPTHGDPDTHTELREYMLGGHSKAGDSLYVSSWDFGNGAYLGADTSDIPAHFMYSGNPVANEGWINTEPTDLRMMVNSGPFTLKPNEPVEIIVAYVVGRDLTSLESVDVTRKIARDAIGFYNTNFKYVPVGIYNKPQTQLPTEYSLSQNYPNPFNPRTTIKYSIPNNTVIASGAKQSKEIATSSGENVPKASLWETPRNDNVTLKIYDILGREVATLVNKQQKAGNYQVSFNASYLTSGVYFYSLRSGRFNESKKMLLIK